MYMVNLKVIKDELWTAFLKAQGVEAGYMNLPVPGQFKGFILPGAFYASESDCVFVKESVFKAAQAGKKWAIKLIAHELGHAYGIPNHDHPTDIKPGLVHAYVCDFDIRAFTRLLRFRVGQWQFLMDDAVKLVASAS